MLEKKIEGGDIRKKNKALILDAAKKEFVTFGFKGASIKRIAERANIPRANIHYYFANKLELYQELLSSIISIWNSKFDSLNIEDDPHTALSSYIRSKVMYSRDDPDASRIFASEIIHGAPILNDYLSSDFKVWVQTKVDVIQFWIKQGLIDDINPHHLLFLIWGATQHYADFSVQVLAALDKQTMDEQSFEAIVNSITTIVLKGCGVKPAKHADGLPE
ncbi:TetR/AcrR family transcriptional regulator [Paraglaciecola hydrolytica]|uniref:TetR family transcriptional regulator n=1 Tax=Paraglaciecola hydrolytica TaxID=1799789 RepID=A0A136A6Y8_9ALTE|nr:TetR/AcrR family transcriptional regulator [Paraglaciecola hydrolytica]KXI30890.1 TetR family transcriptional regulator [Paraglaciecola hydrolytica]